MVQSRGTLGLLDLLTSEAFFKHGDFSETWGISDGFHKYWGIPKWMVYNEKAY